MFFIAGADTIVRKGSDTYRYSRLEPSLGDGKAMAVLSSCGSESDWTGGVEKLRQAYRYFDPVEAFERMLTALDVFAKSDERYR